MEEIFQNNLEETLSEKYPDILDAIRREGYNLDYIDFDIFHEIKYEGNVVGFMTFQRFDIVDNHFAINEAYVIPEFRGNNLLFIHLFDMFMFDNVKHFPRKPTRAFVNVLLKNDYAIKLDSSLVVSYLKFVVDLDEIYKNPKIKKFYKKPDMEIPYLANLFDMDLCSVMFGDPMNNVIRYADFFALAEPRKYDYKKYKCRKKLKRVSERFIDERYALWDLSEDKIEDFFELKEMEWDELLKVENILGTEDELVEDFIETLNQCGMTVDDGFRIRDHIVEGLESGQLTKTSYWQRICYLLDNFDEIDKEVGEFRDDDGFCPFCGFLIPHFVRSCPTCGMNIRDIDFVEHALEHAEEMLSMMPEEVPVDESDSPQDIDGFYNTYLIDFEYDEFADFSNHADRSLGISKIADMFLEYKLEQSLGGDDEFTTYLDYLDFKIVYNTDEGNLDDAFVYLAQMVILASNEAYFMNDILGTNPHSIGIFMLIKELVEQDHSYDVDRLFKKAVRDFRIAKYNNNHPAVLSELKDFFEEE